MRTWGRRFVIAFIAAALLAAATIVAGRMLANPDCPPIPPQTFKQRFDRSLQWLKDNESQVLADGNSALWWMIQTAAQRTRDPYLLALMDRAVASHYPAHQHGDPWKRMVDPKADVRLSFSHAAALEPYQRFFLHALTCFPVEIPGGDTTRFLGQNMCFPQVAKVFLGDPVCTTHQQMGLQLFRRTACPGGTELATLEAELLDDIESQLSWDPIVRDPYYQRLLMLAWNGRADRIKPGWLQRFLDAQEADGGWLGHRRIPELPEWMQPWHWREQIAQRWPAVLKPQYKQKDFHATAQAVLLLALLQPVERPSP